MPTTFNVIFLGNLTVDLDIDETNNNAENAAQLVGETFGGFGNALAGNIQTLSPVSGGRRFDSDGNSYYDQADSTPERFFIDGDRADFDSTCVYDATITYLDGSTADITAVVFQDTNGNTYLAPEFANNADQVALEAGPLLSITLNGFSTNAWLGMSADRQAGNFATCFAAGTLIETPSGPRPVEDMEIGDPVVTLDKGPMTIRWIGESRRPATGAFAPIRIARGALGQGLPRRDLFVSPQHRILVRSRIAERLFGCAEVLVPAKKLLALPGAGIVRDWAEVHYLHILLDSHEIVLAEGAPAESLLVGPQALRAMDADTRAELSALFPELIGADLTPARLVPDGRKRKELIARHAKHRCPLLSV